jgi:hypothetical protein
MTYITYTKIFNVKNQLFVTAKSDQIRILIVLAR